MNAAAYDIIVGSAIGTFIAQLFMKIFESMEPLWEPLLNLIYRISERIRGVFAHAE